MDFRLCYCRHRSPLIFKRYKNVKKCDRREPGTPDGGIRKFRARKIRQKTDPAGEK